jgi:NitT/TauT family transport system substrate-binding protein
LERLVIGYPAPVASLGIIDVMRKAGLFKKYGLDVDLVYIQGSPILTAAMVSGQVPLSFLGGAAIVASAVGGADTVYLACGINTLYWRLFSTPDVKTLDDLKGKKIGLTTIGSQEDAVMRFLLKERGINPDRDVSFLAVGAAPTRLAALSKGVVHASVFIPPQDIAAEKLGLHPLIDLSQLGLYNPGSCFASTKSYIKTHRDTVTRVMNAFIEGLKFYRENKEFVLKITADFAQNRDPEVLNATYNTVTRFQERVPYVNMKGIEFMLKVIELRDRAPKISTSGWIRASFTNWKKPASWTPSGKSRRSYLTEPVTVRDPPIHFSKKSEISFVDTDPRRSLTLHFSHFDLSSKTHNKNERK